MNDKYLQWIVQLLLREAPHGSAPRLLALARIRCALFGLAAEFGAEEIYGDVRLHRRGADALFDALSRRAERTSDPAVRSGIVRGMFRLACRAALVPDPVRIDACRMATEELLDVFRGAELPPALCDCLADTLYPDADANEEHAGRLPDQSARWAAALGTNGRWADLSLGEALERIASMNRTSEMFACDGYDSAIRQAFASYRKGTMHAMDTESLGTLGELVMQGNALPLDRMAAEKIASALCDRSRRLPPRSDAWWVCISYVGEYLAAETGRRLQNEYLDRIA